MANFLTELRELEFPETFIQKLQHHFGGSPSSIENAFRELPTTKRYRVLVWASTDPYRYFHLYLSQYHGL